MTLKARDEVHLTRRIWHFSGVVAMAFTYWFSTPEHSIILAAIISVILIFLDIMRLYSKRFNRVAIWLFQRIIRDSEAHRISGMTYMMVGVTLIVALYPKNVVFLTLLCFAVADPLASEMGIRFGKDKLIGNKSLQGSLAAFAACFVISLVFFKTLNLIPERTFLACLLAGLSGAVSELVPIGKLDDNFTFPVLNATLLSGVLYIFGGL